MLWLHVSSDWVFSNTSVFLGQTIAASELLTLTGSTDTLIDVGHVHLIVRMDDNLPRVSGSHRSAREMKERIESNL